MKLRGLSDKAISRIAKSLKGQENTDAETAGEIAVEKARHHSMGNPYNAGEFDVMYSIKKKGPMQSVSETWDFDPNDEWFLVQTYHEGEDSIGDYAVINGEAHLIELA